MPQTVHIIAPDCVYVCVCVCVCVCVPFLLQYLCVPFLLPSPIGPAGHSRQLSARQFDTNKKYAMFMTRDSRHNCRLHRSRWGWLRPISEIDEWGVTCVGEHVLQTYYKQQTNIALSSAEAELYAMVAASAEALAIAAYSRDLGLDLARRRERPGGDRGHR